MQVKIRTGILNRVADGMGNGIPITLMAIDLVVVAITGIPGGAFFATVAKGFARGDFMNNFKKIA